MQILHPERPTPVVAKGNCQQFFFQKGSCRIRNRHTNPANHVDIGLPAATFFAMVAGMLSKTVEMLTEQPGGQHDQLLPADQFVIPRCFSANSVRQINAGTLGPFLSFFSGCSVAARELANRPGRWVLTYDILHSPYKDLLIYWIAVQKAIAVVARRALAVSRRRGIHVSGLATAARGGFRQPYRPPLPSRAHRRQRATSAKLGREKVVQTR